MCLPFFPFVEMLLRSARKRSSSELAEWMCSVLRYLSSSPLRSRLLYDPHPWTWIKLSSPGSFFRTPGASFLLHDGPLAQGGFFGVFTFSDVAPPPSIVATAVCFCCRVFTCQGRPPFRSTLDDFPSYLRFLTTCEALMGVGGRVWVILSFFPPPLFEGLLGPLVHICFE